MVRRAVGSAEHEAVIDEAGADEQALLVLRLPMRTEHRNCAGVEVVLSAITLVSSSFCNSSESP